jgi:isopentenyl-diphosphate delta-isomerase
MQEENVILVDESDNEIGVMGKMEAHRTGVLHRAISVFIYNRKGELLMHKRAAGKYHSGGLWTNTCCSHPRPGEDPLAAASRRLGEEMGISCQLTHAFNFTYKADLGNGLVEHELDYIFTGISDDIPHPDPNEVETWEYINESDIQLELRSNPQLFTEWFRMIFPLVNVKPVIT